jgi:hypothetical protein
VAQFPDSWMMTKGTNTSNSTIQEKLHGIMAHIVRENALGYSCIMQINDRNMRNWMKSEVPTEAL